MRILVNPDQLRQVAQQLHRTNSDLRGASSNIGRIVGGMSLEIRARTNVDERAVAARRQAEALAEQAESLARYLEERAEAFQRADGQDLGIRAFGGGLVGLFGRTGAVFGGALGTLFSTVLSGLGGLLTLTPVNGMTQLLARTSDGSVLGVSTEAKDYASMPWREKLDELERLEQEIEALKKHLPLRVMLAEDVRTRIVDLDKQIADLEAKQEESEKRAGQWWNKMLPTWPLRRDGDGAPWRVQSDNYEDEVANYQDDLKQLIQEREEVVLIYNDWESLERLQQNYDALNAHCVQELGNAVNASIARYKYADPAITGDSKIIQEFMDVGRDHNIDPMFLVAIAASETHFGANPHPQNNPFGLGPRNTYDTLAEAIDHASRSIDRYGVSSIAEIGAKWAPVGASNDPTGLNNNWVKNVTWWYGQLGGIDPTHVAQL
ncbi:MAG: glucosaminidase domain-containing protein [Anaerolineae bacterium]|nr:glucosaminidase domain-containing protein [Anaerolineae bacterium]